MLRARRSKRERLNRQQVLFQDPKADVPGWENLPADAKETVTELVAALLAAYRRGHRTRGEPADREAGRE